MQPIEDIVKLYPDIDINLEGGVDSYRGDAPIVERNPLAVIIKHPNEDLYLLAKWKGDFVWNGFLTGGIEGEDTVEKTVRKEIHEETGYKNVSVVSQMNFVSHGLFFHPVKNVNRLAHFHLVYAELADLEKDEVSEEESVIADFIWVREKEVMETLTRKGMKILWDFYLKNRK